MLATNIVTETLAYSIYIYMENDQKKQYFPTIVGDYHLVEALSVSWRFM
jgi:hypothetical protein